LSWTRFLPRIGDLFVLQYHHGRRVGIFTSRQLKSFHDKERSYGIVWEIRWILVENEKMPSRYLSEITIMHYLRSGKGKIYRRANGIYD
jgi:hypothetical protein